MAAWRFYQGLRAEWRWYRLDGAGNVVAESDKGFEELRGCMANAETAGFTGNAFQVHTRQSGSLTENPAPRAEPAGEELVAEVRPGETPDEQAAP